MTKKKRRSEESRSKSVEIKTTVSYENFAEVCRIMINYVIEGIRYYTVDLNEVKRYMEMMFERLMETMEVDAEGPSVYRAMNDRMFKDFLDRKVEYGPL